MNVLSSDNGYPDTFIMAKESFLLEQPLSLLLKGQSDLTTTRSTQQDILHEEILGITSEPVKSDVVISVKSQQQQQEEERFHTFLNLLTTRLATSQKSTNPNPHLSISSASTSSPAYLTTDECLECTKQYLITANNLHLLTHLSDPSYRPNTALPSWAPDVQSPLLPAPLDYDSIIDGNNLPDCDSFSAHPCFTLDALNDNANGAAQILRVDAAQLDRICAVSEYFPSPATDRNTDTDIDTDSSETTVQPENRRKWLLSVLALLPSVVLPVQYPISMAEILRRTLLTIPPYIHVRHPALMDSASLRTTEDEFEDWILCLLASGDGNNNNHTTSATHVGKGDLQSDLDLNASAFHSLEHPTTSKPAPPTISSEETQSPPPPRFPSASKLDINERLTILELLPSSRKAEKRITSQRREAIQRNAQGFEARLGSRLHSRRLFVTQGGFLGLGPRSVGVGDGVFFLKGSKMPFVLRGGGDGGKGWKVVGHCFVYGLLEERIERDEVVFGRVCLV